MASNIARTKEFTSPPETKNYAMALATPNKADKILRLQYSLNQVQEENQDLKARLGALESRLAELETKALLKVIKVNDAFVTMAKEAQVQEVLSSISSKVQSWVTAEFQEQQLQQKNALKVCIGGLSAKWDVQGAKSDYESDLTILNEALHPIHLEQGIIESINSKFQRDLGERHSSGQAILLFFKHEDHVRLLQQSRLLKGKKIWIAEELTFNQLKNKSMELKKMHIARREGKWALFKNGKAIIQEFWTPKSIVPTSDTPSTS